MSALLVIGEGNQQFSGDFSLSTGRWRGKRNDVVMHMWSAIGGFVFDIEKKSYGCILFILLILASTL